MARRDVSEAEMVGRFCVFFGSLAVGIGAGAATYDLTRLGLFGTVVVSSLAAVSNAFAAAVTARVCEALHKWAFPDTYEPWSVEKRVAHGAIWPAALGFWLLVSVFYATMNRVFAERSDKNTP